MTQTQQPLAAATTASVDSPLLRIEHVSKSFGAVRALVDVSLDVPAGKVTALAGDNGAGKSVLIKCVSGIYQPDAGQLYWDGQPVHFRGPRDAADIGIETVYQDLALCDNLDVAANMFLGRETLRHLLPDDIAMDRAANRTLEQLGVRTLQSLRQRAKSLSGGQRQSVAIARSALWESRLVIMDEPTAALGITQTAVVLGLIRRLAARGVAVIVISHNLNDIYEVADRIAVLHLGRLAGIHDANDVDRNTLIDLMANGDPATRPTKQDLGL